jgi:hypothetical protein
MRYVADDVRRIAAADVTELQNELDPLDPDLPYAFTDALKEPMSISAVESVEQLAKSIFRRQLAEPDRTDVARVHAFARFFHALGFLFKYKPYGVKAASPFGYSIFDLYPGQGFSFQLHLEPKYEAFHILRAHPDSFIYLSTRPEWEASGERAAVAWSDNGVRLASEYRYDPKPGDVARITSTEIVHSVVGCTLEEYATTSLDAVERLFDQNNRASMTLPAQHPDMRKMVQELHPDLPLRLLSRSESGWDCTSMPSLEPVIQVPNQLLGQRLRVEQGAPLHLPAPADWVKVIVPTASEVRCIFADEVWAVSPGELFVVPPAWEADVTADRSTVIALHAIAPDLVLREWSRQ